jgi:hypothetical protein
VATPICRCSIGNTAQYSLSNCTRTVILVASNSRVATPTCNAVLATLHKYNLSNCTKTVILVASNSRVATPTCNAVLATLQVNLARQFAQQSGDSHCASQRRIHTMCKSGVYMGWHGPSDSNTMRSADRGNCTYGLPQKRTQTGGYEDAIPRTWSQGAEWQW